MGRAIGKLGIYCTIKKQYFVIPEESNLLRLFQNDKIIFRRQNWIQRQNPLALMGTASFFVIANEVKQSLGTFPAMSKKDAVPIRAKGF